VRGWTFARIPTKAILYLMYEMADGYKLLIHISVEGSGILAAQIHRRDGKPEGPLLR
jgi:hypothetical protein